MRIYTLAIAALLSFSSLACARNVDVNHVAPGEDITLKQTDGDSVTGRLVEQRADALIIESKQGERVTVPRANISSVAATEIPLAPQPNAASNELSRAIGTTGASAGASGTPVAWREVTLPAGTVLPVRLETRVGSDVSRREDTVRAVITRAVSVNGATAVPAGSPLVGSVTTATRPGKVKGRGQVAFRFNALTADGERYQVQTALVSRTAPATKKNDALKIGVPAVGGAAVGGILGGKKGAAIGGAIGGGAGTAVVMTTRGKDVRLEKGTTLSVRLTAPVTVRIRG